MTEYRISKIALQNFCGIKSLEIAPNGADLSVYGDNATGKTTIANAFAWLFTGKNAAGTADFDPAPLDSNNAKIHNLETAVAVKFTDGTAYRRVLTEVWTKKRGEVTAQLTGTKTVYYKDDVPLKEKEFNAEVEALFGSAEQFRMLTAVGYFPAVMDWKARRKLLLEMCGDVRDEDVIASSAELSELPELLDGHTVDDYLKVAKSRKAMLKKELDAIPARITENQNAMVNYAVCEGTAELESARVYDGGDACPCCGQKLPPEQIEKAVSEFNLRKSEELASISEKARTTCHKVMISELEMKLESITAQAAELDEKFSELSEAIEAMRGSKPVSAFEQTAEYIDLTAQIAAVNDSCESAVPAELTQQQERVAKRLAQAKELLYKSKACAGSEKRIAELETQQKSLAEEYAACEKGEYLCELFIRAKVSLLDERINSRFRTLKFKLFHEQQNGGLQEICKVLIPCESGLVEYEKANSAARINAGIEIANVLGEYFGVRLPVFCDNAESVTALTPSDGQAVRLVVSEQDKTLRFEI